MKKLFLLSILILSAVMTGTFYSCDQNKKQEVPAIDTANLDTSVNPGEDFDTYANGGWKKLNPLPADRARYGTFDKLAEVAEKQLKDLVEETAKTKNAKGSIPDKLQLCLTGEWIL
jgi:putative endopeptidase